MDELQKIQTEEDYISLKRYDFSLEKIIDSYPDGVPSRLIAQSLKMDENIVEEIYNSAIMKLRELFIGTECQKNSDN